MGRYYHGDIEGKFWFGVQSSDDADFFGDEGTSSYLSYYFEKDQHHEKIIDGIKKCREALGVNKKRLDEFFSKHNGYNDEMIIEHWKKEHNEDINEEYIRNLIGWYARLDLGSKILECVEKNGDCGFEAEL